MKHIFPFLLITLLACAPRFSRCQSREIHPFVRVGSNHIVHFTKPAASSDKKKLLHGTKIESKSTPTILFGKDTNAARTPITPKPTTVTQLISIKGADSTIYVKPTAGADSLFRPTIHPPLFRLWPPQFHPLTHRGYRAALTQSHDTLYINYEIFASASKIPPTDGYPVEGIDFKTKTGDIVKVKPLLGTTGDSIDPKTGNSLGKTHPARFDRKNTYYILVRERLPQVFPLRGFEVGALTAPFQYRPGFNHDTMNVSGHVPGQVNTDVNLALYAGWKVGKVVYRYDRRAPVAPSKYTGSIGPFFSVSKVTLDASNTKLSTNRNKKEVYRSIASLSAGGAFLLDFNGIRAGLLVGWDFASGSREWDFSGRPWFGFGLGYGIPLFQASK